MKEREGKEFGRYTHAALASFIERFALPAAALTLSEKQAHEILRLLDAEARLSLAYGRLKAAEQKDKRIRKQMGRYVSAKRRRTLNQQLIRLSRQVVRALERMRRINEEIKPLLISSRPG